MDKVLVTGAAGFIGMHLCQRLLERGQQVIGIDNLNTYYSVQLKHDRLQQLTRMPGFVFHKLDLADQSGIASLFTSTSPDIVVNLAAQAGVRYSLENPHAYAESNLRGFVNVLEGCRKASVKHLVFASSSSVYGNSLKTPFHEDDNVDHPVSLYAATKKSNELMAHAYSHLFGFAVTGLRFFTVYGPWGRPDMAYFSFTKAINEQRPIKLFNYGHLRRDFTYISDVVEGMIRLIDAPRQVRHAEAGPQYKIYNIGNNSPVELKRFVEVLELHIGMKAITELLPMQPGDVYTTYANVDALSHDVGFQPRTSIEEGLKHFVAWYREYYGVIAAGGTKK